MLNMYYVCQYCKYYIAVHSYILYQWQAAHCTVVRVGHFGKDGSPDSLSSIQTIRLFNRIRCPNYFVFWCTVRLLSAHKTCRHGIYKHIMNLHTAV